MSLEIIRVILLKDFKGEVYLEFFKFLNLHRNEFKSKMTSEGANHLVSIENIIIALKENHKKILKSEYMNYFFDEIPVGKVNIEFSDE